MSSQNSLDFQITKLIVSMFNAAPGADVLAELRNVVTAGESLQNLARNLVHTEVFKSIYPDSLNFEEFSARFARKVLGTEVGDDQIEFAAAELKAMLMAGLERHQVILLAVEALLGVDLENPQWGSARQAFENKLMVAGYFSIEKARTAQTLEELQSVLAPVTSSERSMETVIEQIDRSSLLRLTVSPILQTDTGLNSTEIAGGITRDNTLGVSGTVSEPGAVSAIEILTGNTFLGKATITPNGAWSFITPLLTDGSHSLNVRVTDLLGIVSISDNINLRVDATGPVFGSAESISVPEGSTELYIASAVDQGFGGAVNWALSGEHASLLQVGNDGRVSLRSGVTDLESSTPIYRFTVEATDTAGNTSRQSVLVNLSNVNDLPTASAGSRSTDENSVLNGSVSATDVDGIVASYALVPGSAPTKGSLVFNTDGSYTFNPGTAFDDLASGASREVSFSFTATDDNGATSAPATVRITVTGTNDAPKAGTSSAGTGENAVLTGYVLATDVDGAIVSYALVLGSDPSLGTVVLNTNGTYSFNPGSAFDDLADGATRQVSFQFTATDNLGLVSAPGSVTITVTGTNDTPKAGASSAGTSENAVLNGSVSAIDVDGTVASYALVAGSAPTKGSLVFNTNGTYSFNPGTAFDDLAAGASSDVSFSFTATDNNGATSAPATVRITVSGTNDAPRVADEGSVDSPALSLAEGDGTVASAVIDALANDSDVDGGTLTISRATSVHGSVSITDNKLVFTPLANFSGNTTITYVVSDGQGQETPGTVHVQVSSDGQDQVVVVVDEATLSVDDGAPIRVELRAEEFYGSPVRWVLSAEAAALGFSMDGNVLSLAAAPDTQGQTQRDLVFNVTAQGDDDQEVVKPITIVVKDVFNPTFADLKVAGDNFINVTESGQESVPLTGRVVGTQGSDFKEGDTVTARLDGAAIGTHTVDGQGRFTIPVTAASLRDAASKVITVSLLSTGTSIPAGGANPTGTVDYTVDLAAPSLTVAGTLGTDSGLIPTITDGGLTRDNTVVLSGTMTDAGSGVAKVQVYDADSLLGDATLNTSDGTWAFNTGALTDGVHRLSAAVEDLAGNRSAASLPVSFTVDATGPAISTPATAHVLETASVLLAPAATDARDFTWSLVAKEGDDSDKLTLTKDASGKTEVRLKDASSTLDYDAGKRSFQFTLRATDTAGNETEETFIVHVLDAPEVTLSELKFGTDDTVNIAESEQEDVTVTGNIGIGGFSGSYQLVELMIGPANDWPPSTPATLNADGSFTVEIDGDQLAREPNQTLQWEVRLTFTDSQGTEHKNVLFGGDSTYKRDLEAPEVSLSNLSVTDDNAINAVELAAAQAGGTVLVTGTVGGTDFKVGDRVTVTVAETEFSGSVTSSTGRFEVLVDGSAIYAARTDPAFSASITVSDAAGNTDTATLASRFVVDVDGPLFGEDYSALRVDEGNTNLLFTAVATDAGVGGTVRFDLLGTDADDLNVDSNGRITLKAEGATLDHKNKDKYEFTLRASDSLGNPTDQNVTVTVVNVPEFSFDLDPNSDPRLALAGDDIINLAESTPQTLGQAAIVTVVGKLSGELAGIKVFAVGTGIDRTEATMQEGGGFTINLIAAQLAAQSPKTVQLQATVDYTDAQGVARAATVTRDLSYTVDTSAPVGSLHALSLDTGTVINAAEAARDNVVLSGSVSGEYTAGNTVTVTVGGSSIPGVLGSDGSFNVSVSTTALRDAASGGAGSLSVEVQATDAAGNPGTYSQSLSYTIDIAAPTVNIDALAYSSATDTTATVSGTVTGAAAGATVQVQLFTEAGVAVESALPTTLGTGGSFTVDLPATLAAGNYRVRVSVESAAGNPGTAESAVFTHNPLSVNAASNTGTAIEDGTPATGTLSLSALAGGTLAAAAAGSYLGTWGTLAIGADNGWTYTLNDNAQTLGQDVESTDVFSVALTDGRTLGFTLTVRGVNDAPEASDITFDAEEDEVSAGSLPTADDIDAGDTVTYELTRAASNGTAIVGTNGAYSYTPNGDFFGEDSFTYTISDGRESRTYTVTVQVADDGEPIVVSALDSATLNVTEGAAVSVALEATELVGEVRWDVSSDAALLGFSMVGNVLTATNAPDFDTLAAVEGSSRRPFSVTVIATDEAHTGAIERVITLWVGSETVANNQPTLTIEDRIGALTEGDGTAALSDTAALSFADLDGTNVVTVSASANNDIVWSAGTLSEAQKTALAAGFSVTQSAWTYSISQNLDFLSAGDTITMSFNVVATDDSGAENAASLPQKVTITITGSEDVATLSGDVAKSLTETNATLSTGGTLTLADLDATDATIVARSDVPGTYGTFNIDTAGVWTYSTSSALNELNAGQVVTDTFAVTTSDGGSVNVVITITGTNDIATLSGDVAKPLTEGDAVLSTTGTLTLADLDATDATLVEQTDTDGTYGKFSITAAGAWTYTSDDALNQLDAGEVVTDTFAVTTSDGGSVNVVITVTGTNDAPTAVNDTNTATEGGGTTTTSTGVVNANGNVLTTSPGADIDPDSTLEVSSFKITGSSTDLLPGTTVGASYGELVINSSGAYTYTPYTNSVTTTAAANTNALEAGAKGYDSFTYTVRESTSPFATSTATLIIEVTGSDDAVALTAIRNIIDVESGAGAVALEDTGTSDDDFTVTAWEANDINSANGWTYTATIGASGRHTGDTLSMSWPGGIDPNGIFEAVWNAETYTLTVTAKGTAGATEAYAHRAEVFAAMQFEAADGATTGTRTISYSVTAATSAGGLVSNVISQQVNVINEVGFAQPEPASAPENASSTTTLSLLGVTGTPTWRILPGEDAASFSLTGNTLSLAPQNYESPQDVDADNTYRVQVEGTADGVVSSGWVTMQVTNENDPPTGLPTILGTAEEDHELSAGTSYLKDEDGIATGSGTPLAGAPVQGMSLTANGAAVKDDDGAGIFSYQWLRDGAVIAGATNATYLLDDADVGKRISVRVSYTDGLNNTETVTSAATLAVVNVNDAPTGSLTITGTPTEDQQLIVVSTLADADGLGTLSYQWLRAGSAISGAKGTSYTLGDADVGSAVSVRVRYTDGQGQAEEIISAATSLVSAVNDAPTGTLTITGTPTEDQQLTAVSTLADADGLDTLNYQWLRDGVAISGATGTTYLLGDADTGKSISVRVRYTDGQGHSEEIISAATSLVSAVNDAPTGTLTITGASTEDQQLTAVSTLADADGLGTLSYQWLRAGSAISGATGTTYLLGDADVGSAISVRVRYTDGQGHAEEITSAATPAVANVNDAPTGALTITGTPAEDQQLTVASTLADADGLGTLNYQWLRAGSAISGATGTTYTLGDADVGSAISVRVRYTDGQGYAEEVISTPTAAVANVPDAPTLGASSFTANTTTPYPTEHSTTPIPVTMASLLSSLNPQDADGDLSGLKVASLASGTLTVNGVSYSSASLASVPTLTAGSTVSWTPGTGNDLNGLATAFAVRALDSTGLTSSTANVQFNLTPVNDAPSMPGTLTTGTSTATVTGWTNSNRGAVTLTFADLLSRAVAQSRLSDADGQSDIVAFRVVAVSATGTFKVGGLPQDDTSVRTASVLINSSTSAEWTPGTGVAANTTSGQNMIRVYAIDASGATSHPSFTNATTSISGLGSTAPAVVYYYDTIAPSFSSGTSASVAENISTRTAVYTAAATDTSPTVSLTYSLGGIDAERFDFNTTTRVLTFKTSPDFEVPTDSGTNNVYDITITATDAAGNATNRAVAITVTDVAEAGGTSSPVMADHDTTLPSPDPVTEALALALSDQDVLPPEAISGSELSLPSAALEEALVSLVGSPTAFTFSDMVA